jgi:transcriptional regulator with GAF, ATPase, and Fis domain/Tfp pilus assembly protein PilF
VAHHTSYGSDSEKALESALKLGDRYLKRGRGRKAVRYFECAEGIIPGEDVEARVDVLLKRGEAFLIQRDYESAEALFNEVEDLLKALPNTERAAKRGVEALIRLGGTFMKMMAFSRARAVFTEAKVKLHTKVIDPIREINVENFLGSVLMNEGRYREAKELFERTRQAWQGLTFEDKVHVTNNDLGMVLLALRDTAGARAAFEEDLAFAEELGDDLLVSRAYYNLAQLGVSEGDYDGAISSYKECSDVCKRIENTELLLRAYNGLGNIYHVRGDLDQSVDYYERGLALHERAGDARGGAAISVNIGIIENSRKNYDAALDALIPAIEVIKGLPDKSAVDWTALARGLLEMGDVYKNQGELDMASESLSQAYDIAVSHDSAAVQRFWILFTLAEVAREKGDEAQIKSLIAQMNPIAASDAEKEKLNQFAKDLSIDASSISKVVAVKEEEKEKPRLNGRGSSPYEKVLEINKLINAERDLDYVLKTVIYYALELAGAESGAIILLDEEGELAVASQRNMDGREDEVAFSRTLARRVLEEGRAVITDDALADDRFTNEESIALHQLKSIMCLPVRAKGRVIGVLYLDHRFSPGAFNDVDMKLIDAFADQVGLAIVNAKLVEMLSQRKEALSAELSAASVRLEHYEELLREREMSILEKDYGAIATHSMAMRDTLRLLDKISDTDLSVLLVGESGVGKELIARALHDQHGQRKKGCFVAINCGAIPETLMESELFGYKAGAFTGANRDKKGFLEEASGGTIFLDEIGELDPQLQVKLLRVLQEKEFVPVGGTKAVKCDVRVVAATNRDVERMVKEETFREDLYYRLCQVKVVIPPLRERTEDIPELIGQFVAEAAGDRELQVHPRLMKRLIEYPWPGNVRELKNLIHVACAMTDGNSVATKSIPATSAFARYFANGAKREASVSQPPPKEPVPADVSMIDGSNAYDDSKTWRDYERDIIAKAYASCDFHAATAATELGISAATVYKRVNEWNLKDRDNPIYGESFSYHKGLTLDDYRDRIFKVALEHADGKPTQAIANLSVSQGYFYKVMKRMK